MLYLHYSRQGVLSEERKRKGSLRVEGNRIDLENREDGGGASVTFLVSVVSRVIQISTYLCVRRRTKNEEETSSKYGNIEKSCEIDEPARHLSPARISALSERSVRETRIAQRGS